MLFWRHGRKLMRCLHVHGKRSCLLCQLVQSAVRSAHLLSNLILHRQSFRYFVAFSFDTTLGVSIAIIFHKAAVKWAKQMASRQGPDDMSWQKSLAECGSYGERKQFVEPTYDCILMTAPGPMLCPFKGMSHFLRAPGCFLLQAILHLSDDFTFN